MSINDPEKLQRVEGKYQANPAHHRYDERVAHPHGTHPPENLSWREEELPFHFRGIKLVNGHKK